LKIESESLGTLRSRAQGAVNHTDWIRAEKDGTFDALVRRKCGREDSDARLFLKCHVRFGSEAVIRPRYRFGYPPRLAPNAHDGLNGDLPTLTRLSRFAGLV
jgi:hypothetical protein